MLLSNMTYKNTKIKQNVYVLPKKKNEQMMNV